MKLSNFLSIQLCLASLLLGAGAQAQNAQNAQMEQTPSTTVDTLTSEAVIQKPDMSNVQLTAQDDAAITNTIGSYIKSSPLLSKLNLTVTTENGIVTLSGNADSDSQVSALVEFAQSVGGVKDVNTTNIAVQGSQQPMTDMLITAKVKGLFIREEVFGTKDIASVNMSVETKNGVVYLTGVVDNQTQIDNAIKLAESVQGVKKVEYSVKKVTTSGSST